MRHSALLSAALSGLLVAAAVPAAENLPHAKPDTDKCYGIAKAGRNECASATGSHACAGHALKDRDPGDWITLPRAECIRRSGSPEPPRG
jgi:uncharacterized membrane protein